MEYLSNLFKYKNNIVISGLTNELNSFYVLDLLKKQNKNIIVLTNSLYEANSIYSSLSTYTDDVMLFPMDDFLTSVAVAMSPDLKVKRLETIDTILNKNKNKIIVTNLMGYIKYLPSLSEKEKLSFNFSKNMNISREEVLATLNDLGYNRTSLVTSTGEYAERGFIIDIFIIEELHPIRIEFFGDEIDTIRYFDESTQLSINSIDNITCKPFGELISENHSSLIDYLDDPIVVKIDSDQIDVAYKKLLEEIDGYNESVNSSEKRMYNFSDLKENNIVYLNNISNKSDISYDSKNIENFNSDFELLKEFVLNKIKEYKTVIIYLSGKNQIKSIQELFEDININVNFIKENEINIINKKINKGFMIDKYVVISEYDIEKINNTTINYKNSYKIGKKLKDFGQLELGDYVVHTLHGIGIYNGVITLTKNGLKKDYLQINYAGSDKVYIPVEKLSTIYKYSSKEGLKPKINKLNSTSWAKTKHEIHKKIHDISEELIKLYSIRSNIKGMKYIDYPEENIFGEEFIYDATADQLKAIHDVNNDLASPVPMDRLLCGDVGFGKTEVAFRGIFKTILNNKQVFYLCPTTILSSQQYQSAKERFKNYPIEIALLNRFTTKKETERILKGLESGTIDLVFGTHRLLSDDVKFKKLGLLIVDEEQRFGVSHKEKIKKYKNDVNVLTLSATPIPRTLKMAMSGLRDLSVIDTAPVNRYPVQTYVLQENDLLIKDALYKELSRNGQSFILYNNVQNIENKMNQIHNLVPEARITYANGQMSKTELENVMESFINHEYDILICTTIIETGIDIANANTLIILDADHFGLSQLYQIRGRVGRSNRIAYAYLMYDSRKMLNDVAIKRLQAIKEFTELGSGYKIAMRDLSIRGAGDILGSEQAGFVDSVGMELYMKMMDDEIKKLNGIEVTEDDDSSTSLVNVETHISDDYVSDEDLKIEIHQKINEISDYDSLLNIKSELEDRFGKINKELEIYMYEEWFEKLANKLSITKVLQSDKFIEFELNEDVTSKIKGDKLFMRSYQICTRFQFKTFHNRLTIVLPLINLDKHFLHYLIPMLEEILLQIKEV